MALDWNSLSSAEHVFAAFVEPFIEDGVSSNEMIRQAQAAGLSIRRTNALDLIRQIKDITSTKDYVSSLNYNDLPNPNRLAKSVFSLSKQYSYTVQVNGYNNITSELDSQHISVTSDKLISKQDAIDTAMNYIDSQPDVYGLSPTGATVTNIRQSPT